jgi:lysophospholipase L1-like esterase
VESRIAFYGDSLTAGIPGVSYVKLIQQVLPQHKILNFGKINDTPLSLYRRIENQRLDQPVDVAFVFVGVNDLLVSRSWLFSRIRRQWARDDAEFRHHYTLLLKKIAGFAGQAICISPVFIGENFESEPQHQLGRRCAIIQSIASDQPRTEYLDIRTVFSELLRDKTTFPTLRQNLVQSVWDSLMNRNPEAITRVSAARGLHYTIDGVHLNSAGARIIAVQCLDALREEVCRIE